MRRDVSSAIALMAMVFGEYQYFIRVVELLTHVQSHWPMPPSRRHVQILQTASAIRSTFQIRQPALEQATSTSK